MSAIVVSPFVPILSLAGLGLNAGHLYVGILGEDPVTNPQAVYWDENLTIPAIQPLDVLGGYIMYLGSPATAYTGSPGSLAVYDKDAVLVWQGAMINAGQTTFADLAFQFLGGSAPASNEVMGMFTADRSLAFFPNFDGTGLGFKAPVGKALGAPALGDFVITVNKNGAPIGTITVAQTTGTYSFATTDAFAPSMIANDYLTFVAQATVDSAFINSSWTLCAEVTG